MNLGQLDGEVGRWLDTYDRDLTRAFEECTRADFLIRMALAVRVDRKLVVLAAAESAAHAIRRAQHPDLRPMRCVVAANKWVRGEGGPAEAWAAAFAASQLADEIAAAHPLAAESALAAAAAGFACDPRADDVYYAQRGYPVSAVEHTIRAFGADRSLGNERCLEAARKRITVTVLTSAVKRASVRPPPPPL